MALPILELYPRRRHVARALAPRVPHHRDRNHYSQEVWMLGLLKGDGAWQGKSSWVEAEQEEEVRPVVAG
jgi:hypothetical protein